MKTKEIHEALRSGHVVVLRGDTGLCICHDLFGGLVVVSRLRDDEAPLRQATTADKRRATIL